jgi:hypothetical protein
VVEKMNCKDCIHYNDNIDFCMALRKETTVEAEHCKYFKDRSRFIELPCKIGDVVFCDLEDYRDSKITERNNSYLDECVVTEIVMDKFYNQILITVINYKLMEYAKFWADEFGKLVFTKDDYYNLNPTRKQVRKLKYIRRKSNEQ